MTEINYDKFGHCVVCHKKMVVDRVVNNEIVRMITPDYREEEYFLDNGTKMRVAICSKCKESLKDDNETVNSIMDTVIAGWEVETRLLVSDDGKPDWTQDVKDKHMEKYSKLKIVTRTEKKDKDTLDRELKKFKEKKEKTDVFDNKK